MMRPTPPPADWQPYPDELLRIAYAMTRLESAFEFTTGFQASQQAAFNDAAKTEFAKIGIEIRINWEEICRHSNLLGPVPTGIWMPGIEPIGRTRKESETDHDRIKHGIQHGLLDGQPGYIRADGTKHEDPIRKIIT